MPKMTWGSEIDADAIENAETREQYAGEIPPSGVYRFKIRFMQKTVSSNKNPMLKVLLILDGSWKPEHKQYDGCPVWEQIPVIPSTAFRVRELCDALNVTAKEFMDKTVGDDEGFVQKIGKLRIADEDRLVMYKAKRDDDPEYGLRLARPNKGAGFLPFQEEDDDEDEGTTDDAGKGEDGDDPF